jgi:hypothetical protein
MRKTATKYTRLNDDLRALQIGETVSHSVNLELRQVAYDLQKPLGIKLCIREIPTKKGRFEITRIK